MLKGHRTVCFKIIKLVTRCGNLITHQNMPLVPSHCCDDFEVEPKKLFFVTSFQVIQYKFGILISSVECGVVTHTVVMRTSYLHKCTVLRVWPATMATLSDFHQCCPVVLQKVTL